MKFSCFPFPVLPGSAEVQVISGVILKRLLIAYLIGSICAKNQNLLARVKVIASQRWDVFETPCTDVQLHEIHRSK